MKIVNIFAYRLFAFHYEKELDNEYDRLMDLWYNAEYIYDFVKTNKNDIPENKSVKKVSEQIMDDAILIDETLVEITKSDDRALSQFFKPLNNQEYKVKVLSLQKGRESYLRIYAIRIDDDTFVITGGAIKLHHLMEDREHTKEELSKLNSAKDYLKSKDIFDEDSFFEFLNED
ncbi:hypothetical protein [Sphingobacterium sp. GVS05A]|uniref:hypothetical protein n=1 Tax=Sphingobacterium sp. GVS05A TaxID=2862679 RepID=UPI001CBB8071|nr:hypothetical protein [Sphingobacterium sp. GVS05A]